ncbi:MAG TPA: hypothetical protein VD932_04745 [Aquabacterium sp.]|nr:hypothetical protein [Aquabacterium sp.]
MTTIKPQIDTASLREMSRLMVMNLPVPGELIAKCRRAGQNLVRGDDPHWGWTTLVACAAAEWDVAEAERLAKNAIDALGPGESLLCNLSVSFKQLCRLDLAVAHSERAYRQSPNDVLAIHAYVDDLFILGRFREGAAVTRRAAHLTDPGPHEEGESIEELTHTFQNVVDDLEEAGVEEERLRTELTLAIGVLREARLRYLGARIKREADPESGGFSIVAEVQLMGSLEDELRLGAMLAPKLAEHAQWDPCSLNTGFFCMQREDADVPA